MPIRNAEGRITAAVNSSGYSGLVSADQMVAERLEDRFPERWAGTTAEVVSAELRARGVRSVDVKTDGRVLKGCRLADVEKAVTE